LGVPAGYSASIQLWVVHLEELQTVGVRPEDVGTVAGCADEEADD